MNHNSLVIGYRHAGIIVKDMEKSLRFYRDILGLEVLQDFSDKSEYMNTVTGITGADVRFVKMKTQDGVVIEILEYRSHPTEHINQPIFNVGACHLALRVADAEEAYQKLVESGVKVLSNPVLSSEKIAKVFFCLDPNNVRIEIVEMIDGA